MLFQIAKKVNQYGGETVVILAIRAFKYVSYLGVMMSRLFLGPITPLITHEQDVFLTTIGSQKNLEKLEELLLEKRGANS